MGGSEDEQKVSVAVSLKRALARGMAIVRTRVDLFAVELQLEKARQLECFVFGMLLGGFLLLGVTALSIALVLHFREESRVAVLCGLGVLHLAAGFAVFLRIRKRLAGSQPFRHTLEELKKDQSCWDEADRSN